MIIDGEKKCTNVIENDDHHICYTLPLQWYLVVK